MTYFLKLARGQLAKIDPADAIKVQGYSWYQDKLGYARASTGPRNDRKTVYLHRLIALGDRFDSRVVDHINRDKLDCRRENLRLIFQEANCWANVQRFVDSRSTGSTTTRPLAPPGRLLAASMNPEPVDSFSQEDYETDTPKEDYC